METKLIMTPAGLTVDEFKRKLYIKYAFYQEELPKRCSSFVLLKPNERLWMLLLYKSLNIWCLLLCLHFLDGLHRVS